MSFRLFQSFGRFATVLVLSTFFLSHTTAFALTDTIAGYSTLLQAKTVPNAAVTFEVTKPDGSIVMVPAKADSNGLCKIDLYDIHTRQAGTYQVRTLVSGSATAEASYFTVFPDGVSAEKSQISVNDTLAKADGSDAVMVSVKLMDRYENPARGHLVNLISSRAQDMVVGQNAAGVSDDHGIAIFNVSSSQPGLATFAAFDSTSNTILAQRAEVAFLQDGKALSDVGGDFDSFFNIANAAGSLHHFEISDLPAVIQPGQNVSFKITAQDENNATVQNYVGKIHFSAEGTNGGNVSLPEDYTFKAEDLGVHQFALGLSFTQAGTYKIVVNDLNNVLMKGEKTVTVGAGGQTQQNNQLKPTIETPVAGTYSQNTQTVSGTAPSGYTVKIYDNEQEAGNIQADNAGKYTYQTSPLSDGAHKMYVVALDNNNTVKGTSDLVEFTIDTTAPETSDIVLNPASGIAPGQVVNIDILSEEELTQAAIVFNGTITELHESSDRAGHYTGSVQAPETPGTYPIDIVLVDQLGNEGSYKGKAEIVVAGSGTSEQSSSEQTTSELTEEQTEQTVEQPANVPPSNVTGLLSYGGDKRVTLVWDSASDNTFVQHYRVYYGFDPATLDRYADTRDASTTWYIPNLENGREYYFSVTAFDSDGTESFSRSEMVSAIPYATELTQLPRPTDTLISQSGGPDEVHGAAFDAGVLPRSAQTGPEVLWLLSGTGVLGGIIQKIRSRRKFRK